MPNSQNVRALVRLRYNSHYTEYRLHVAAKYCKLFFSERVPSARCCWILVLVLIFFFLNVCRLHAAARIYKRDYTEYRIYKRNYTADFSEVLLLESALFRSDSSEKCSFQK